MSMDQLNNLLRWSISNTNQSDSNDVKKPLSQADMNFIKGALNSVHEHELEITNAVSVINNHKVNDKAKTLESFQILEDHFDDHPSNSSNLVRCGLLQSFIDILSTKDMDILNATLSIISTAVSNNESIAEEVGKSNMITSLLSLKDVVSNTDLEPKLLSALSSSVRNSTSGESKFVIEGGLEYLCKCILGGNIKTRERALLLLNHFLALNKISATTVYSIKPFNLLKSLIPLDPKTYGIQYCEICTTLFKLVATKYNKYECAARLMDYVLELASFISTSHQPSSIPPYRSSLKKGELSLLKEMLKEEIKSISSHENDSYDEIVTTLKDLIH